MEKAFWLKNLFLIACLLFTATPGFSQNKTVTGTVTDATGEPLIGASVLQQGTSNGVITDIDGKYSIQVPPEATLEFSYVGMVKQAVKVGNRSVIDVQMNDDSQMLAETVVIGYGSMKKSDLTGAVSGFADCTGHYLPLACTINGSRILDAGRAALGVDYDELAKLAFASKPGANGITLVPYFDGERTPNRPNATATFSGMTLANTTRENLARAFVEGLLCSQRDCLELIRSLGASITRILLIGGGAKSEAIRTLAPSILGMDVTRPATDEYVAIGAARQAAWVLSGETEPPAWQLTIDGVETGEPTEAVYEAYAKARG